MKIRGFKVNVAWSRWALPVAGELWDARSYIPDYKWSKGVLIQVGPMVMDFNLVAKKKKKGD